ncbi:MAG: hypothetical protein WC734_02665 [Patescibacteria group bacterium]|jgi:hypothetical protein
MRRLLVPLFALVLLVTPMVIPTVQVTTDQNNATIMTAGNVNTATAPTDIGTTIHLANIEITFAQGGNAQAWNLIYELCRAGVPGMCELYQDGQGILW